MNSVGRLKQPPVFPLSIVTVSFEHFGFYVLSFAFVLYVKDIFELPDKQAFSIDAVFIALVYLTPVIGGYLADVVLGIRRTIVIGLLVECSGLILLCLPQNQVLFSYPLFYPALALVIIGVGFFRVGPTHLMGRSYTKNDPRIDGGFTLYYMSKNIGAFFSPIAVGILHTRFNWNFAFLSGTIALLCGLLAFFILRHRAAAFDLDISRVPLSFRAWVALVGGITLTFIFFNFLLKYTFLTDVLLVSITLSLFAYFVFEIVTSNRNERLAIIACLILIFVGMTFFIMFFQVYSSVTLFIERSVFKPKIFGYQILTTDLLSLSSFWIISLGPLLVFWYKHLSKRKKDLSIIYKFSLGLFSTALCFLVLAFGIVFPNHQAQISCFWIILALMLYSLGELLVSALGVAMITKIAPKRMYGVMMGSWFLIAMSFAAMLSGKVANLASIPKAITDPRIILNIYGAAYLKMGLAGAGMALSILIVSRYINKIILASAFCESSS